jgi:drug/metabolite transporter (DMT)-like permease
MAASTGAARSVATPPAASAAVFAVLCAALGVLAIAASAIFAVTAETGPAATAVWRLVLSGTVFYVVALVLSRRPDDTARALGDPWTLLAAVGFAGTVGFLYAAQRSSSVANAAVLTNLAPIVIALVSWLVLRRPVSFKVVLGLTLAFGSTLLLVGEGGVHGDADRLTGDVLGVLSGVSHALYYAAMGRAVRRMPAREAMVGVSWLAAAILLPAALLMGERVLPETAAGWTAVAMVALLGSLVGQGLLVAALTKLSPLQVSATALLEPLFAGLLALLLLGEVLTPLQTAAGVAAMAGVVVVNVARRTAGS